MASPDSDSGPAWILATAKEKFFFNGGKLPRHQFELLWYSVGTSELFWVKTSNLISPGMPRSWPIRRWRSDFFLELLDSTTRGTGWETHAGFARDLWKRHELDWFRLVLERSAAGLPISWEEANGCYQITGFGKELPRHPDLGTWVIDDFKKLEQLCEWKPPLEEQEALIAKGVRKPWEIPGSGRPAIPPPLPQHFDRENYWLLATRQDPPGMPRDYEVVWCSIPHGEVFAGGRTVGLGVYDMDRWPGASWSHAELIELLAVADPENRATPAGRAQAIWKRMKLDWFRKCLDRLAVGELVTYDEVNRAHLAAHDGKALRLYPHLAPVPVIEEWETEMRYGY